MDLQDQRTGMFGVSQIWDISHEIDGEVEQRFREDRLRRTVVQGLTEILKDGRCYEVTMTISTAVGDTYPPGVPADGTPCLGRFQGTPLSMIHTQYVTSCRLIVVLADPKDAEIGETVKLDAFPDVQPQFGPWMIYSPDGDCKFEYVKKVGWKRIS